MKLQIGQVKSVIESGQILVVAARLWLALCLYVLCALPNLAQGQTDELDIRELKIGETVERPLKGGEVHSYTIELKQGQVLRIDVREKGVDLHIGLFRLADTQIIARADFGYGLTREVLTNVIEQTGVYGVFIGAPKSALSGNYQLSSNLKESATTADIEQIKAERLLEEGFASRDQDTEQGLRGAIGKWEEALQLWKKAGEKYWEGFTANFLGLAYDELGEKQKALEFYNLALLLYKQVGEKSGEAIACVRCA